jgi:hypothetical protein
VQPGSGLSALRLPLRSVEPLFSLTVCLGSLRHLGENLGLLLSWRTVSAACQASSAACHISPCTRLPVIPHEAHRRREIIRQLFRHAWTIKRLAETFPYYSPGVVTAIVGKARTAPSGEKQCACGCGQSIFGRQRFAATACQKRYYQKVRAVLSHTV